MFPSRIILMKRTKLHSQFLLVLALLITSFVASANDEKNQTLNDFFHYLQQEQSGCSPTPDLPFSRDEYGPTERYIESDKEVYEIAGEVCMAATVNPNYGKAELKSDLSDVACIDDKADAIIDSILETCSEFGEGEGEGPPGIIEREVDESDPDNARPVLRSPLSPIQNA